MNKAKEARRRARKQQQKAIHANGQAFTAQRVIPNKKKQQPRKLTIHEYTEELE